MQVAEPLEIMFQDLNLRQLAGQAVGAGHRLLVLLFENRLVLPRLVELRRSMLTAMGRDASLEIGQPLLEAILVAEEILLGETDFVAQRDNLRVTRAEMLLQCDQVGLVAQDVSFNLGLGGNVHRAETERVQQNVSGGVIRDAEKCLLEIVAVADCRVDDGEEASNSSRSSATRRMPVEVNARDERMNHMGVSCDERPPTWNLASWSSYSFCINCCASCSRSLLRMLMIATAVPLCVRSMNSRYDCTTALIIATAAAGSLDLYSISMILVLRRVSAVRFS